MKDGCTLFFHIQLTVAYAVDLQAKWPVKMFVSLKGLWLTNMMDHGTSNQCILPTDEKCMKPEWTEHGRCMLTIDITYDITVPKFHLTLTFKDIFNKT